MSEVKKHALNEAQGLVPELRFPEFEKAGKWNEQPLKVLAHRVLLKNKDEAIKNVFTNSAARGIVDQREYFEKDIANQSNLSNYYVVEDGDFVYNPRISTEAPVGPISKNKKGETGVMSPLYTVFRFYSKINQFYEYYFISKHWYNSIRKASNTGSRFDRMSITDSSFLEIKVLNPREEEQKKIASCLSTLDELIAAQIEKLEALRAHKKGLLQNLFLQEGQVAPNYRFPEFQDEGEWELPKLEDKMNVFRGASPRPQGDPRYYGGKIPRLMIEDVTRDGKYSTPKIDFLTEEGATKSRLLIKGSVVLSCSGTRVAIPGILAVDACIHDGWLGFKNLKKVDPEFLYYLFCNLHERIQGDALAGGVFNNLTTTILKEMRLGFPRLTEQQKIASFLSALDELIKAQTQKIKQLQLHKKGLMQGLFPRNLD